MSRPLYPAWCVQRMMPRNCELERGCSGVAKDVVCEPGRDAPSQEVGYLELWKGIMPPRFQEGITAC